MADKGFEANYRGHEAQARVLLLEKGLKTAEELAIMDAVAVEQAVNEEYEAYPSGDDWLLVPKGRLGEFCGIVTWIER
ncbi:MAG: hypothetical protein HFI66_04815 [Lachnospiraceae bacterium]|jgi:hypothetical protein|nr:hypothetical protein [Lachnospiraceae bacterium]